MTEKYKPILCLDFDGVLHSYKSGWKGADVIPDQPVFGALNFLTNATVHFNVQVFSSRSGQKGGIKAMERWCLEHFGPRTTLQLSFPNEKPPALVTIDDRAICFTGSWPHIQDLLNFKPWNKK